MQNFCGQTDCKDCKIKKIELIQTGNKNYLLNYKLSNEMT